MTRLAAFFQGGFAPRPALHHLGWPLAWSPPRSDVLMNMLVAPARRHLGRSGN